VFVSIPYRLFVLVWAIAAIAFTLAREWGPAIVITGLLAWVLLVRAIQKRVATRKAKLS
jgi:hypothetical protein